MTSADLFALARVITVIVLVVSAAVLTTPPNEIPLALRGLAKLLGREQPKREVVPVPVWKKLLAFALVIIAFILAQI